MPEAARMEKVAPRVGKFNMNRAQVVDENFVRFLQNAVDGGAPVTSQNAMDAITPGSSLTCADAWELFESQVIARHQDITAREMRARNEGFYTIGSAGHEGNAVVGRATRRNDMAFLHYRSGAFMAERARKVPDIDFVRDVMLSFAASTEDSIAGGRHKVWGSLPLCVPPQTSTIASHLPKAVGTALLLARAKKLGVFAPMPQDAIVICSFGDASANHSVAQTAFNVAAWAAHQRLPVPILFLCEDNGIGISVETPAGWIASSFSNRYGFHYVHCDGLNLIDAYDKSQEAIAICRHRRIPVFLHMSTVRLLGHAGSDVETEYHTWDQIEATESRDPLIASAKLLMEHRVAPARRLLDLYESIRSRVRTQAESAAKSPKLTSVEQIVAPLAPYRMAETANEAARVPDPSERVRIFGDSGQLPELGPPRHMAALINLGLHDLLLKYPESILFGEDVARKGGVYHVTTGLASRFGPGRVFNTLLDETSILGLAIGAGHLGLLAIPEIQYLAYYHNAEDQVRGEAGSLQYFSNGQYRNPMVIRIQGWAYQKGFGGHFHNDNSIAALRDVPGLVVATPSRGDDAVKMMRTCMAMAKVDGRVVAFLEPIALYMMKDLYAPKDQQWSFTYPAPAESIPFGEPGVYDGDATDLAILTFANGVYMSLRAAKTLREVHGIRSRVVDLRWLTPLNEDAIAEHSLACGRALVVDEGRRTGGLGEAILAVLMERTHGTVKASRITAVDTYIPLGPAADCVLPSENDVVREALALCKQGKQSRA